MTAIFAGEDVVVGVGVGVETDCVWGSTAACECDDTEALAIVSEKVRRKRAKVFIFQM